MKLIEKAGWFEVNLDVNKALFIRNTQLIRCYSRIDDRVQPLGTAIRQWAESNEITELSGYNLVLMLIHYLQIGCSPPVVPVLQSILPNSFLIDSDVRQLEIDVKLPPFKSASKRPLDELFTGFFDYFSSRFDYAHHVISIRNDRAIRRADTVKERKMLLDAGRLHGENEFDIQKSAHFDLVYIEDPIDLSNTARLITHRDALADVIGKFKKCHTRLKETHNLRSIIVWNR